MLFYFSVENKQLTENSAQFYYSNLSENDCNKTAKLGFLEKQKSYKRYKCLH